MTQAVQANPAIHEEDKLRAELYDFLAALLAAPPTRPMLDHYGKLEGDDTDLGSAFQVLAKLAGSTSESAAEREFSNLFIGVGRGELLPYASFYMTGFLNEKPLAMLRKDMARLSISRAPNVYEPEDNIASLCEMMAGLILGRFGTLATLEEQKAFFNTHIAPWAAHFFTDLEDAKGSVLYAPVGTIGRTFIGIEKEAFRLSGS